jgi:hypothetical protein
VTKTRLLGQPVKGPLARFQQIVDSYLDHDLSSGTKYIAHKNYIVDVGYIVYMKHIVHLTYISEQRSVVCELSPLTPFSAPLEFSRLSEVHSLPVRGA